MTEPKPRGAWCSMHKMHPEKCFDLHYPHAKHAKGAKSAEEMKRDVEREHLRLQKSIKAVEEKFDKAKKG